jgi:peroxiredoxin/mono/diheme cytochrome c family protein
VSVALRILRIADGSGGFTIRAKPDDPRSLTMQRQFRLLSLLTVMGLAVSAGVDQSAPDKSAPAREMSFTLKDVGGREVALADFKDNKAIVVVFTGTECPVSNFYLLGLKELHEKYAARGVQFLAVNSNSQDGVDEIARHAKQNGLPFPVLKDGDQKVADLMRAQRTPEVLLLDSRRRICYRGRIDDQYGVGYRRAKPGRRDLVEALEEVLADKPVSVAETPVAGCLIGRPKANAAAGEITYANQISRIFQKNCQECHRPGEIGPFALQSYRQAKGWADMIRETVGDGRMPPWYADPRYGKFANDRRLSGEDKKTLLAWIDQGCAKGEDKDLPPPKAWHEGWWIGKPDAVITMQEDFTVPADAGKGGIPYKYFTAPTNFTEDKWVMAAEARPGNRSVVHHIIATVSAPGDGGRGTARQPLRGAPHHRDRLGPRRRPRAARRPDELHRRRRPR